VENYLAAEVIAERIGLADAQKASPPIGQYLHDALDACPGGKCASGRWGRLSRRGGGFTPWVRGSVL